MPPSEERAKKAQHQSNSAADHFSQIEAPGIETPDLVWMAFVFELKTKTCSPRMQVQRPSSWPSAPLRPASKGTRSFSHAWDLSRALTCWIGRDGLQSWASTLRMAALPIWIILPLEW